MISRSGTDEKGKYGTVLSSDGKAGLRAIPLPLALRKVQVESLPNNVTLNDKLYVE